jgi:hypothetical protein
MAASMKDSKEALIRAYYTERGYEMCISRDGYITICKDGPWLEVCHVSEYKIISDDLGYALTLP